MSQEISPDKTIHLASGCFSSHDCKGSEPIIYRVGIMSSNVLRMNIISNLVFVYIVFICRRTIDNQLNISVQ